VYGIWPATPDVEMQNWRNITGGHKCLPSCFTQQHRCNYYNIVRDAICRRIELEFQETKRKIIIITILKTQEEKLPLCIKRESFKPREAAAILRRRKRGIRQCHWNPPLQFLIRPKTLRHVGLPVEPIPGHCIFVCIGF